MSTPRTIAQALSEAQRVGLARLDAQWLLGHVLGQGRSWLLAHDEQGLSATQDQAFQALCDRRLAGEPFAYLVGECEFHGLRLAVTPAVLIPRPDTEILVDWALALLQGDLAGRAVPAVIDLGTGSGAVALAIADAWPAARVTAVDLSTDALAVARANGHRLGLAPRWRLGDWWQAVGAERFDLVLSNPPYIDAADPHLADLRCEPVLALSPGPDGLAAIRRILAGAPGHLTDGGWLLFEHGWDQSHSVQALMRQAGFTDVQSRLDLGGHVRCTGGRWRERNNP